MIRAAMHPLGVRQSILGQRWAWRGGAAAGPEVAGASGLPGLTAALFLARGAERGDFGRLARPTVRDWLPDPSALRGMDAAAARLADAVVAGEAVTVFGDYDVDGATSAALLVRFLRGCGASPGWYIPDRLLEGYGPSAAALVRLAEAGARLVVTVDCGAQAFDALAAARAAGLDVIVADHHQCATAHPDCVALVNPNRLDETPGHGHLAAVGVCFLLAVATARELRRRGWFKARPAPGLLDLLDLVALGTVADVVPVTGLNRAYVAQGLKVIARRTNAGLAALADAAGLTAVDARALGFALGPRINAGGRVGSADLGVRLLTTDDADEAAALAAELDRLNGERREVEGAITEAALAAAALQPAAPVVVVAGAGWHPGVIGIVAARVKEAAGRPAIVIDRDTGKGSGRSIAGVDLGAAVIAARDAGLLAAGGGHAMAAGLTLGAATPEALAEWLGARLGAAVAAARADPALLLDAVLAPAGVCADLCATLDAAGPYGAGWPAPRVAAGPFTVVQHSVVGADHLRLVLAGADGARVKAVAFRHASTALGAALAGARGRRVHVAGRVARDDWGATPRAELHLDDAAWAD